MVPITGISLMTGIAIFVRPFILVSLTVPLVWKIICSRKVVSPCANLLTAMPTIMGSPFSLTIKKAITKVTHMPVIIPTRTARKRLRVKYCVRKAKNALISSVPSRPMLNTLALEQTPAQRVTRRSGVIYRRVELKTEAR